MNKTQKGVWLAVVAAIISGIAVFVNKFAVGVITPPLIFTATKNFGVGLLIVSVLLVTGKWKQVKALKRGELIKLGLIGVIGGSIPFYLFFTGLAQTSAAGAQIINKSLVLWVALLAIPLLKEKLSLLQVAAVAVLFSANAFVGGFTGLKFSNGELMVLAATMLWAVEHVIAKKVLATVDPDLVTGARMGLGSVILVVAAQVVKPGAIFAFTSLNSVQWMWMVATMATLLTYVMVWYRAIKLAPVSLVASVLVGATLVTNLLSAVLVTHVWSGEMLVQAAVSVGALGVLVWGMKARQREALA